MYDRPGAGWIVVGLDGYGHDRAVLTAALRQATQSGSRLYVVRSLGIFDALPRASVEATGRQETTGRQWAQAQANRAIAVRKQLRHEVEQVAAEVAPAIAIEYEVERGDPATTLLAAADEADMIVVGTRNDGEALPLLLGTVSQDVAVHARCPVLLVPLPPSRFRGA
ncbi:MAG TPA: universal stress protein [Planosporangium sp.]|jgi:nucleotide-binding universal stress UspA family protein|nr:universal stress protein [Planosporangium sp.]